MICLQRRAASSPVAAESSRSLAHRSYLVTSWVGYLEVAGGGLDGDDVVALIPSVVDEHRECGERDDGDGGVRGGGLAERCARAARS